MTARKQRALWAGAIAGAVVAGTAAGLGAERKIIRAKRLSPDPASEAYSQLAADRVHKITLDDGISLQVEEVGPADAPVSMVFFHGFIQSSGTWHFQRTGLADLTEQGVRLVFVDQRGHGGSGRGADQLCTIAQLGHDARAVLAEVVPAGELILVGHSMGGMAIMALAETAPELFEDRVIGVALIATSAGSMTQLTFGLPGILGKAVGAVRPKMWAAVGRRAAIIERARRAGTDFGHEATLRIGFGRSGHVPPSMSEYVSHLFDQTSLETIAAFMPAFLNHSRLAALSSLADVETIVLVGDKDLVTPVEHAREIAKVLPGARLIVLAGAGHMVMMERAALVNLHLRSLVSRARSVARTKA